MRNRPYAEKHRMKRACINGKQQKRANGKVKQGTYEKLLKTVEAHYEDSLEFDKKLYPIFNTPEYQAYYEKWEAIMKNEWKYDAIHRNYLHTLVRKDVIQAIRTNPYVRIRF